MFKKAILVSVVLLLSACASTAAPPAQPPLRFTQFAPIPLEVTTIDVIDDYKPTMSPQNIDQQMDPTPATAVHTWVADRLRARAATGYLRVSIKDASITEHDLSNSDGAFTRMFTREQAHQLDARILVEIYGERRDTRFSGYTTVEVTHSTTVPEDATPAEMATIERHLLDALMTDFNQKAEDGIYRHLADLLHQ